MNTKYILIICLFFYGNLAIASEEGMLGIVKERNKIMKKEYKKITNKDSFDNVDLVDMETLKKESVVRNPFSFGERIDKDSLNKSDYKEDKSNIDLGYVRAVNSGKVPKIELQGIIEYPDGNKDLALIAVNGDSTFIVKEGDEVSYEVSEPSKVIKVIKVDALKVVIELGQVGNVIVLR